jgi:hypothetical protein
MVDKDETSPQDDEDILCVRLTDLFRKFFGVTFVCLAALAYYIPLRSMTRGDYFEGLLLGFGCLGLLVAGVDMLFSKRILFYRDRVVKEWYLLGRRTIPYARAKLAVNPAWIRYSVWPFPYPSEGQPEPFGIYETDGRGKVRPIQIPIGYGPSGVAPDTRNKVEAVICYLVGVEDRSKLYEQSRIFVESDLPKELL